MRRWLIAWSVIAMLVILTGLSMPVTASPHRQCGNACGIPGCQTCKIADGSNQCIGWCSGQKPPKPPGDGGGGGQNPTATPNPNPNPGPNPPPTEVPPGGPTLTPVPTATPEPGEENMVCYDCMPWPYCPDGYADDFCLVTSIDGHQWISTWSCMADASVCETPPTPPNEEEGVAEAAHGAEGQGE